MGHGVRENTASEGLMAMGPCCSTSVDVSMRVGELRASGNLQRAIGASGTECFLAASAI